MVHEKQAGVSVSAVGRLSSGAAGNGLDPAQGCGAQRERVSRRSLRERIGRRRIRRQSRQKVTGVRSQSFLAKVFTSQLSYRRKPVSCAREGATSARGESVSEKATTPKPKVTASSRGAEC